MKVLVLGGTGAMGTHLVKLLYGNGFETVVTTRKSIKTETKIQYLQGNAHDIDFLKKVLKESWDVIVDFMIYSTADFKTKVELLLNATSQYVFLSSSRVYADSEHAITESSLRLLDVSEDIEFLSTDEYSLAKARQEDVLKQSGKINWTIIRPYITYSEKRLQLGVLEKEEWLYRALHGRTIVFSKEFLSKATTLTYGLDVSRGILAIIGRSDALGETFHISKSEADTWKYILAIYSDTLEKHTGKKTKVFLQEIDSFMRWKPSKYQIIYDRLYNRCFDNTKISKFINTSDFINIDIRLKECLEKFLKSPNFASINWKIEALKDRITNEHASLWEIKGLKQKIKYLMFRYFIKK